MKIIEEHVLEVGSVYHKRIERFSLLDDGRYLHKGKSASRIISSAEFKEIERTGEMKRASNLT